MHRQSLLLKFETSKRTHDSRGFTFAEFNPAIQLNAVPECQPAFGTRCAWMQNHGEKNVSQTFVF
jgi:hypothetical protein